VSHHVISQECLRLYDTSGYQAGCEGHHLELDLNPRTRPLRCFDFGQGTGGDLIGDAVRKRIITCHFLESQDVCLPPWVWLGDGYGFLDVGPAKHEWRLLPTPVEKYVPNAQTGISLDRSSMYSG
jgi:hypothetical protein